MGENYQSYHEHTVSCLSSASVLSGAWFSPRQSLSRIVSRPQFFLRIISFFFGPTYVGRWRPKSGVTIGGEVSPIYTLICPMVLQELPVARPELVA